ncbi:MAG: phage/plasmid primase, P4 family [Phycisphaerales bacterium]
MLDERMPEIVDGPLPTPDRSKSASLRPGDDFNLRGDIGPLLERHGWRRFVSNGTNEHWTRPGKEWGTSATLNGTHFYVFSSNAEPFDAGRAYTRFAVRAYLEHSTDFSAAARELSREGFGSTPAIMCSDVASGRETYDIREFLGTRDPSTGRIIVRAGQTVPSAKAFLREHFDHPERFTLAHWQDEFYVWERNKFVSIPAAGLHAMALPWLDEALTPVSRSKSRNLTFVRFKANPRAAAEVVQSVASLVHVAETRCPCWLSADADLPNPAELLVCPSGTLHLPTGEWIEPTPTLFTTTGLDFDFEPKARSPSRWLTFLDELFGGDREAIDLLQQWFGYCLTPDTSLQKMLLIVGPPRSGKGTIARVLQALVGAGNCVAPTVGGLTGSFGLQPLVGKSLAIVSDARFTGHAMTTLVERLLCVSGEDVITVDRKHLPSLTVRLPTRVMFLTNEIPEVADTSGALASRFEALRLRRSFLGEENLQLASQLLEELPGILNWAIEGWHRLRSRGRLTSPESSVETKTGMAEAGSPVLAFINECCLVGSNRRVPVDDVFRAWCSWCESNGMAPGTKQNFGRQLGAVCRIERRRSTKDSFYEGIAIKESDV